MKTLQTELFDSISGFESVCAIRFDGNEIPYRDLNTEALKTASILRDLRPFPRRVGIIGQRCPAVFYAVLGSIYAGCTYVPINSKFPKSKIDRILKDAEISVLVGPKAEWINLKNILEPLGRIRHVLCPDENVIINVMSSTNSSETADSWSSADPLVCPMDTDPDSNAYIMYTSGSTGKPKGVTVSGRNVLHLFQNLNVFYELEPGYRSSQTFDLSFDPSVCDMFYTWIRGGTLCVLPADELYCPSDYIIREEIEFWHSVPSIAGFMNRLGYLNTGDLPSLKHSIFVGEPLRQSLVKNWRLAAPHSTIENRYGPTESTVDVTRYESPPNDDTRRFHNGILPIGLPFEGVDIRLVDDQDQIVDGPGHGEIVVGGGQVTKGYLGDQEMTSKAFVRMPWDANNSLWYKTGDLAFYDDSGNIECLGRIDKQVKLAGRRVELGEIEHALASFDKLNDVVVVPYRDDNAVVIGLVAFASQKLLDSEVAEIRLACQETLEDVFFPKKFVFVDRMPTLVSGKIDRKSLEERARNVM